jgi:ABC-type glucose/galactose transport system permease subunit
MMDHLKALGIKTLAMTIISAILTPMFTNLPATHGIIIGLLLAVIAYLVGDLLVLPNFNNTAATATDVVLAALIFGAGIRFFNGTGLSIGELVFFSAVVGMSEWFLHKYLARFVLAKGPR